MDVYKDALSETSTEWAPWHIIPADHKWVTRAVVADILTTTICSLDLKYPVRSAAQKARLAAARRELEEE